jgi:hypothetical protein
VVVALGPVHERPVTAAAVEGLIDRVWFYGNYEAGGSFVLDRVVRDEGETVVYEAVEGRVTVSRVSPIPTLDGQSARYGGPVFCDRIRVWRSTYAVDKETGEVEIHLSTLKELVGRCN